MMSTDWCFGDPMWQWAIATSLAGDPVGGPHLRDLGEIERLSEELDQLAARDAWSGVERVFRQLQALGGPLSHDDWMRGAHAARSRGDFAAVRERLIASEQVRNDRTPARDTVTEWLDDIEVRFGHAVLRSEPTARLRLECEDPPLDPDLVRAIAFARAELGRTGQFDGLLPVGLYRLLDTRFGVTARLPAQVDLRGAKIPPSRRRQLRLAWREDGA